MTTSRARTWFAPIHAVDRLVAVERPKLARLQQQTAVAAAAQDQSQKQPALLSCSFQEFLSPCAPGVDRGSSCAQLLSFSEVVHLEADGMALGAERTFLPGKGLGRIQGGVDLVCM